MTKTSVSIAARGHAEKTDKTVLAAIAAAHADTPAATVGCRLSNSQERGTGAANQREADHKNSCVDHREGHR